MWQADAFLDGRAWIPFPVPPGRRPPRERLLPGRLPADRARTGTGDGRALLPFPPLPGARAAAVRGGVRARDRPGVRSRSGSAALGVRRSRGGCSAGSGSRLAVRALTTLIFATGTVWWWAASVGSTWYLAHLVAANVALLAVGVALRHDRTRPVGAPTRTRRTTRDAAAGADGPARTGPRPPARRRRGPSTARRSSSGSCSGIAVTARLPLIFAAPFFVLVGGGGTVAAAHASRRRSAASLPVAALLGYTFAHHRLVPPPGLRLPVPASRSTGYPTLGYHADWAVEDLRYVPQNLGIMLGALPRRRSPTSCPTRSAYYAAGRRCARSPGATRAPVRPVLPDRDAGRHRDEPPAVRARGCCWRCSRSGAAADRRLALGTAAAVLVIALFNLAHFSQGWVQWGYRFSLDFIPFLLPMVALGAARPADGRPRMIAYRPRGRAAPSSTCGASPGASSLAGSRPAAGPRRGRPVPPRGRRRRRRRRSLRLPDDAAARRRRLGHGRGPDGPAAARDDAPDRASRPTSCSAGSRRSLLAPLGEPAFRMNLLSAVLVAPAPGHAGRRSCAGSTCRCWSRSRPALGLALTPIAWRDRRRGGRPRAPPRRCSRSSSLALVRWEASSAARATPGEPARRPPRGPGPRRSPPRVFGVALANHALTLLLVAGRRAVRARGRPGGAPAAPGWSWRRGAPRSASRRCSTSSCRCGPARSRRRSSTATRTRVGASGTIVLARQFQGDFAASLADLAGRRCRRPRPARRSASSASLAVLVPFRRSS